jgi:hypothetical protein
MDPKTLEALNSSIKKWEDVENGGPENGAKNCPLCQMFSNCDCIGCPVDTTTNEQGCNKEWDEWVNHYANKHSELYPEDIWIVHCDECKRLAHAETEFLRSLLPRGEQ